MSQARLDEAATPAVPDELPIDDVPLAGPLGQVVAAAVPVAVGLGCLAYAVSLGLGTPAEAGPGLWPALASLLLIGAGSWTLLFERGVRHAEQFSRGAIGIGVGIAGLVVFVVLISRIGFEIPTLLTMVLWLKVLGRESWLVSAAVSAATTTALYLLFITLLGVPIPRLAF